MSTLCFRIDSLTDDTLTLGIYDRNPMTLQLDATAKDGSQSSSTVDMSCLSSVFLSADDIKASFSCDQYAPYEDAISSVSIVYYDANGVAQGGQDLSAPSSGTTYSFSDFSNVPSGTAFFSIRAYFDNYHSHFLETEKYPLTDTFADGTVLSTTEGWDTPM